MVYRPALVVWRFSVIPVALFVAATVAPGMAAPVESATVPWMPPSPPVCAGAEDAIVKQKKRRARQISRSPCLRAAFGKGLNDVARQVRYMFGGLQTERVLTERALYVSCKTDVNRRTFPNAETGRVE
jgi:hypothetical protein